MFSNSWQLQQAKNKFSEVVKLASSGKAQLVTKNGVPVVYVVDARIFESLVKPKESFKELLLNRPHKEIKIDLIRDKDFGRDIEL
jgi:antitoxin Phd